MEIRRILLTGGLALILLTGCQAKLKEVRAKTKFGPSFRHKGAKRTDSVRWTVQQGFDFKWDNGITTGVDVRRRDVDDGTGDNTTGVFFRVSFPVWKAEKKPDPLKERVRKLEKRLAELEAEL